LGNQKVRRTHPHLQRGERMLDGFAAHKHGLRVPIEPAARLRQVNPHFLAIFISGEVVRQLLATGSRVEDTSALPAFCHALDPICEGNFKRQPVA
jgi:hypothetical protein